MVSILIPTLNRPEFLYRALKYYRKVGFEGVFYIGDSSDRDNASKNLLNIDKMRESLNIDYKYYEKDRYDVALVLKDQIERAKTPYIAICCDDDFLNVNGVRKCAKFLENNADYVSARGIRLNFSLKEINEVYGEIDQLHLVPSLYLENNSARVRWATYMNCDLSTMYNVHKKDIFQKMFQHIEKVSIPDFRNELLQSSTTCLLGKTKNLDVLYNLVQLHEGSISYSGRVTIFDQIMSAGWSASIKFMSTFVSEQLMEKDMLNDEQSKSFVYNEFEKYLVRLFLSQTKAENNNIDKIMNIGFKLRNFIKGSPKLLGLLRYLIDKRAKASNLYNNPKSCRVSLSSIISSASPYRNDFLAVADIISNSNA